MSEHTPGRLALEEVASDSGHIKHLCPVDSEGMSLLTVVEHEGVKFAAVYSDDDARRLVACWNACDGLGTDLLENIVMVGDTIKSRFALRTQEERESIAERDSLRAVNAELLAALERFASWADSQADAQSKGGHATFDLMALREERDSARAAIARATAQANVEVAGTAEALSPQGPCGPQG
jgi:hypothetical protein